MNSPADARRKPGDARRREPAAERTAPAHTDLDVKMRTDEEVWLRVIEAQRLSPEPSLEETLAKIRQTIAEDGV